MILIQRFVPQENTIWLKSDEKLVFQLKKLLQKSMAYSKPEEISANQTEEKKEN